MIQAAALVATVWIVGAYAYTTRTGRRRPFDLANALGCLPIILAAGVAGAWATIPLTLAFGTIGAVGFLRGRILSPGLHRRPIFPDRRPALPMASGCASHGACGHCGARGGGECVLLPRSA